MSTTSPETTSALSNKKVAQFHRDGFIGPLTAVGRDEMDSIRRRIEQEVITTDGPQPGHRAQSRHLDCRVIYDLVAHPNVVNAIVSVIGPDVMLWRTNMMNKPAHHPGSVPWHQDYKFWPIEPPLNVSAWIAIDDATLENACVQVIPGSHLDVVPHIAAPSEVGAEGLTFDMRADVSFVDTTRAVPMELKAGQFFVFVERMLHYSPPNESSKRRMAIAGRFSVPFVRVEHEALFPGHAAIMVAGDDMHGFNRFTGPPR